MTKSAEADVQYMERCIELAQQAREAGETAVGSLLVRDGQILGEGAESTRANLDPAAHAEIEAIREACRSVGALDLSGCTLYSTVEPCLLCGYAIRVTRIGRVVIGTSAGEVGAVGSAHAFLGDSTFKRWGAPPTITSGVLEAEAAALLAK
jgi:tRNA(adenine34) deaminase